MSISSRLEYVRSNDLIDDELPTERSPRLRPSRRRVLSGLLLAAGGLPLLTLLLVRVGDGLSLEGQVLLYLLLVVVIAVVGGVVVAVFGAVAAAFAINFFFVLPLHTLRIRHADQAVALGVFVVVAAVVSGTVELATRRARAAQQAGRQAETLSALAGADLDEHETLRGVLEQARTTFSMESVTLMRREASAQAWAEVERAGGRTAAGSEAPLRFDVPINAGLRLTGRGPALFAEDQRVLHAFAAAAQTAYDGRRLSERASEAKELSSVDRQRTALLGAVGHDLRTPLAGIKASVSTLRQSDVQLPDGERAELLATIEQSADRLDGVVGNLLDASRLQAGALGVTLDSVALDEVVAAAVLALPATPDRVKLDVPDDLPLVCADPGLLERVLVNLLDNALRYGAGDAPVEVAASAGERSARLEIADHGPGVSAQLHDRLFEPFQRLDDRSSTGVGLGLTVARGFTEAMGGAVVADRTPGGGLTIRVRLPLAEGAGRRPAPAP